MSQDTLQQLKQLAEKVNRLANLCERLQIENESLKTKQRELVRNRAQLMECSALVKSRVESMITRLKTLGQGN
ncbi:MAG: TIGR02449 family protein [Methylococcales bacterium]|jgi:cell division protein ZapB|nr:TIGR02449 family protein [Methylococcales bacterium]MEE2767342.1 TIGR02449 family protein [Pseudomonadota bacterium]